MPLNRRVKNKKPARDQAVFNKFRRPIMEILKKLVVQEAHLLKRGIEKDSPFSAFY